MASRDVVMARWAARTASRLGAVLGTLALSSAVAHADDWGSLGFDAARSRFSAERSGSQFTADQWQYTLPPVADAINRVLVSSPAVADGFVVLGTTTGAVVALGANDGRARWTFQAHDGLHASPAIVRGTVVVPSFDGNLYGLRLYDGNLLWTRALGSVTSSSPAAVGDSVVVASGFPARTLVRLDAVTGKLLWETPAGAMDQASNSSVVVTGNQVIVGAMAGTYFSFDLSTGAPLWSYVAGGAVHMTAPLVAGGKAFFAPGGSSHSVHAVDAQTGQLAAGWPIAIPDPPADGVAGTVQDRDYAVSSLAAAGGLLLFQQRTLEYIDSGATGVVDTYLMREETVAVDAAKAAVVWRLANGRVLSQSRSAIPAFGVCPTPLVYADRTGRLLAVTASTLSNRLRVVDVATGTETWGTTLSAATRGSPVLANGRLIVATDAGVVHGLLSSANEPPLFGPSARTQAATVPSVGAVVGWQRAMDPEGDPLTYDLRIDRDGEVLSSWEHEIVISSGDTSLQLPWALAGGGTYTYAVRARDDSGAWSEWSSLQTVVAVATPDVAVGGQKASSLVAALASARPGDAVQLGAGVFRLTDTVRVPAGVTLSGGGPQQTVLDGSGLDTGVSAQGSSGTARTSVDHMTITGSRTGVAVGDTGEVTLRNVIIRDTSQVGIDVGRAGVAQVINATLVRAGIAVRSAGAADVRDSLIMNNASGLVALTGGQVVSNYNDVHANDDNYTDVTAGAEDLDRAVEFVSSSTTDFHLNADQPTTDRGSPTDEWANEPAPNGGRVNLGAFGNTSEAELSPEAVPPPIAEPSTADGGTAAPDGRADSPDGEGTSPDGGIASPDGAAASPGDGGISSNAGTALPNTRGAPPSPTSRTTASEIRPSGQGCNIAATKGQRTSGASLAVLLSLLFYRTRRPRRTACTRQRSRFDPDI